jgi:hypothetical protein
MIRISWLRRDLENSDRALALGVPMVRDHSDIVIRTRICVACRKQTRLQIGTVVTSGTQTALSAVTKVLQPLIHSEESGTITE